MGHDSTAFKQKRNAPPHMKKPLSNSINGKSIIKSFPISKHRKATYRNVEGQTSSEPLMPAGFKYLVQLWQQLLAPSPDNDDVATRQPGFVTALDNSGPQIIFLLNDTQLTHK